MLLHLIGLSVTTLALANAETTIVRFDVNKTSERALPLSKQLMSLSIEFGNTLDFFGDVEAPNNFSKRLLQNVVDRSASPAVLRIGGNTQDVTEFCEDCDETMTTVVVNDPSNPKGSEAVNVTYNPKLYQVLAENVPQGSPIILGMNYRNWTYELALAQMDGAFRYMDQELVMAYELGNEPNLYGPHRPKNWNITDYGEDMESWIPRLRARSTIDSKWQMPAFAGPVQNFPNTLNITNLVKFGIPQRIPGIRYFSDHGYPYDICTPASAAQVNLTNFLDHDKTVKLLSKYEEELAAAKSLPGTEFHMGETGSVACHGKDGVSNTLGVLLWELDYALTGASMGIDRFFFHNGQGDFYYSMWEPKGTVLNPGPHIYPAYYAMLFVADLVGDLEMPRIAALPSLDTKSTVQFAIYNDHQLQKLVIINTELVEAANASLTNPTKLFDVSQVLGTSVVYRRLTGPYTAAKNQTSWAGQAVDSSGAIAAEVVLERAGDGIVFLRGSEAVIVERRPIAG